jgi:hypothetical protein
LSFDLQLQVGDQCPDHQDWLVSGVAAALHRASADIARLAASAAFSASDDPS